MTQDYGIINNNNLYASTISIHDTRETFVTDVKIKKLKPQAIIPTYGSEYAAGADLYACLDEPVVIQPRETVKIGTGIAMSFSPYHFAAIYARSGLATKQGLRPSNCVGICDSDYRGEYIVALHNDSDTARTVEHGERIAQVIFQTFAQAQFDEVADLDATERGEGGFGSTGI